MTVKRQTLKNVFQASWMFGHPVLRSNNNSKAFWSAPGTSPYYQKGGGWLAELYGGVQTGDDWAAIYIPVNELPITVFEKAQWSYYMTTSDNFGVNIVIWLHDPEDFDKRCEVTQRQQHADLEKSAGWNAHEFNTATVQMYYWGENTTGTNLTAGTDYAWTSFQADNLFKAWTIYRISFEFGWHGAAPTFGTASVAEVKLNEIPIPLFPRTPAHRKTVKTSQTMLATAKTTDEVIAHHTSSGVDWDFDFGGTGYIVKAWLANSADITPRLRLYLFSNPPTGMLNDEGANTNPVTADLPYFLGHIDFPAMQQQGTGDAFALATPSTTGNLPLEFDSSIIYGVLVQRDATATFTATALTIALTADMEDN